MRSWLVLGVSGLFAACAASEQAGPSATDRTAASADCPPSPPGGGDAGSGGSSGSSSGSSSGGGWQDAAGDSHTGPQGKPGYLHTSGGKIVDAGGNPVRLTGVSWFGLETGSYAPHGLWSRSMASMLDQMKTLGFNVIRVPFSTQLFDPGSTPNGVDATQNPDLVGLKGPEILDKLIAGAKTRGIKILLDRHRPDSGAQSPLWYTDHVSEQRWIDDWKMLATRYANEPTVIGADLHNEPHERATWGDGSMTTDWRLAAERCGNAILSVNPNWLIVVEGVENVANKFYWWGGNLAAAGANPVRLNVPNRVVYSPHDYPPSVYNQSWFTDPSFPNNLATLWENTWGYLATQNTAPILVGEFGTKLQTQADKQWLAAMVAYIGQHQLSFTFWSWNPNSGDTGGILADDWQTVNADKMTAIKPILAPMLP